MPESPLPNSQVSKPTGLIRRTLSILAVDRSVGYALALRVWQLSGGMVSVLLISQLFTKELQGYYYTFSSILALQVLFDLGLGVVIINTCSHEWSRLRLDESGCITGDDAALSRLVGLGRLLFRWYGIASLLFAACVGIGGTMFLSTRPAGEIAWQAPWIALVILTGLSLWTLPFTALLEGCGQVMEVNRLRLFEAITINLAIWIALLVDGSLWVAVVGATARLAVGILFLGRRVRTFFAPFFQSRSGPVLDWRREVWPMQWRLGLSSVAGYFAFSLFTPVLFHSYGPTLAGQMGMTWALLGAAQMGSLAWLRTRVPRLGSLVAEGKVQEFDQLFWRLTKISFVVIVLGGLALCGLIQILASREFPLSERLLPILPTVIFVVALVANHVTACQSVYVHAHRQDPVAIAHIVGNTLIGITVAIFGSQYGAVGVASAYLGTELFCIVPLSTLIWLRFRKKLLQADREFQVDELEH